MIKRYFLAFCIGLMFLFPLHTQAQENKNNYPQIRIVSGNKIAIATLNNSRATQEFLAMLPLTLTLNNYGTKEKISYLPRKLSASGSPSGYAPQAGDIAYYAPWGNLAIFRQDFSYSKGLIKLGKIEQGFDILNRSEATSVTIEVINLRIK